MTLSVQEPGPVAVGFLNCRPVFTMESAVAPPLLFAIGGLDRRPVLAVGAVVGIDPYAVAKPVFKDLWFRLLLARLLSLSGDLLR